MILFRHEFVELKDKAAVLPLALNASVRKTVFTDIRGSYRFQTLDSVDEVLISEHITVTQHKEVYNRSIYYLREVSHLFSRLPDRVCAVLSVCPSTDIPDGPIRSDAEIRTNRLLAAAKAKLEVPGGGSSSAV